MSALRFWKLQSVGNDFVLVHEDEVSAATADLDRAYEDLAIRVSRRRFGVGSDGLLAVSPVDAARIRLRMFNPDGTEDFCGNGLRCAAKHAFDQGWVGRRFWIEHLGRRVEAEVDRAGEVAVRLDSATFEPEAVPLAEGLGELFQAPIEVEGESLTVSSLSTGSTHTVIVVDELPDTERFQRVSASLETDGRYPARTSVIWAQPEGDRALRLRIWERGAGETLGCGTGSTAAAVVWARMNLSSGAFSVHNPGGLITAYLERWDAPVLLRSSVDFVFSGRLAWPTDRLERAGSVASKRAFPR